MVEVEIEHEKENKLMHRRELSLTVDHEGEGTPTRGTLTDKVASLVNASKGEIIIDNIDSEYGKGESSVEVRVYDDEEYLEEYEREYFKERD
ncbi:MAG: 30S ribosomal protein S24e [Candidatus Thermoplasmatota archaeon]|nr:30S ribosomal protein S24e [Candidatus Thermoplasmatota archaeon]